MGSLKNNVTFWTPIHPVRLPARKFGICRYSCVFAPCRTGASTIEIAILSLRAPFYHIRVGFCKELTTWLFRKAGGISERTTGGEYKPDHKRRPSAGIQTDARRLTFRRKWTIGLVNVKVTDSEPCLQFEKHLQKHRYELYFHFNL